MPGRARESEGSEVFVLLLSLEVLDDTDGDPALLFREQQFEGAVFGDNCGEFLEIDRTASLIYKVLVKLNGMPVRMLPLIRERGLVQCCRLLRIKRYVKTKLDSTPPCPAPDLRRGR